MRQEADDVVPFALRLAQVGDVGQGEDHSNIALFAIDEWSRSQEVASHWIGEVDFQGAGAALTQGGVLHRGISGDGVQVVVNGSARHRVWLGGRKKSSGCRVGQRDLSVGVGYQGRIG